MCLVVIALGAAPHRPLLLAANRDERHERAAQRAGWWSDLPQVFGGRDLEAGGTWLAVDRRGRIAAVTNIRNGERRSGPRSRGALPVGFLTSTEPALSYAARAAADGADYAPFSLLLFDGSDLGYASNRGPATQLDSGIHAFSNAPYGVEWPKTASARAGIARVVAEPEPIDALFDLLAARGRGATAEEQYMSAHFVAGPVYGTRCSTVIVLDADGTLTFAERSFDADGRVTGESRATFTIERG
jgi:uncharacterized protein with NRDE domain